MPQLDVRRLYEDGSILFAADLDAIIDDIETLLNSTKLNDDNIQDAGITGSTKLVDGSVTAGKIGSSAVTTAKINDDAVTAAKIADGAIDDAAKLASNVVTTAKILDSNVTTAKIADSNVTTAKIADSNVTTAKIADSNVTTAKIANSNVTAAKMETSINLPGAAVKMDSRDLVVGGGALAVAQVSFAGHSGAGFSTSGTGWTATGDGNLQSANFSFVNAFSATPIYIKGEGFPGTVTLSSVSTTGFSMSDSAGAPVLTAFKALFVGPK